MELICRCVPLQEVFRTAALATIQDWCFYSATSPIRGVLFLQGPTDMFNAEDTPSVVGNSGSERINNKERQGFVKRRLVVQRLGCLV